MAKLFLVMVLALIPGECVKTTVHCTPQDGVIYCYRCVARNCYLVSTQPEPNPCPPPPPKSKTRGAKLCA